MTAPQLYYSTKTENCWLVKPAREGEVQMSNMVEGGVTITVKKLDFESAVKSGTLVFKEFESKMLELHNREVIRKPVKAIKKHG